MASITYYVVVPFNRDDEGMLVPREAQEAPNREAARRRAQTAVGSKYVGAIAFQRTGDPESGDFNEGELIAEFGEVDRDALQG